MIERPEAPFLVPIAEDQCPLLWRHARIEAIWSGQDHALSLPGYIARAAASGSLVFLGMDAATAFDQLAKPRDLQLAHGKGYSPTPSNLKPRYYQRRGNEIQWSLLAKR